MALWRYNNNQDVSYSMFREFYSVFLVKYVGLANLYNPLIEKLEHAHLEKNPYSAPKKGAIIPSFPCFSPDPSPLGAAATRRPSTYPIYPSSLESQRIL